MKSILACIITMTALGAAATTVSLDTSTLPSSQGWEFRASGLHAGVAETDIVSTDGAVLTINTMDYPTHAIGSSALYRQSDVVADSMPTALEWTSRTVAHETDATEGYYGFFAAIRTGNRDYSAGILPDRVTIRDGAGFREIPLDATKFHTYRIETVTGSLTYDFYIDGEWKATAAARVAAFANSVMFGDGTGHANADSDITALEFRQFDIGFMTPLNVAGCVEATGPDGATVRLLADDPMASSSKSYTWSTYQGDTGSGTTFELDLGVNEEEMVTLTMVDSTTGESKTVTKEICVSDTTPPEIIILSPEPGDIIAGNNLGLEVMITDAVDKKIPDYLVTIGNSYEVVLDPGCYTSKVKLFKPSPMNGPVPTDITVSTMDSSGNVASETIEVLLQHDNRKK